MCTPAGRWRQVREAAGTRAAGRLRLRLLPIDNCIDRRAQGGTPEAFTFVWCTARRPSPGGSAAQRPVHHAHPTAAVLLSLLPTEGEPRTLASESHIHVTRRRVGHLHRCGAAAEDQYVINSCRQIDQTLETLPRMPPLQASAREASHTLLRHGLPREVSGGRRARRRLKTIIIVSWMTIYQAESRKNSHYRYLGKTLAEIGPENE